MTYFEGTWENIYQSTLELSYGGDGYYYGSYSSTTGSSGSYYVLGWGSADSPTTDQGVGLSLALFWRPYDQPPTKYDGSWDWVSGFGGQGIIAVNKDKTTTPTISLNHALVATDDLLASVAPIGTYLDKLVYTPYAGHKHAEKAALDLRKHKKRRPEADPIDGTWMCASAGMTLQLVVADAASGYVEGTLTSGGIAYTVRGFADTYAAQAPGGPLRYEGLTLAAIVNGQYVSLAGSYDNVMGSITVLQMTSNGTPAGNVYVQTAATQLTFVRG